MSDIAKRIANLSPEKIELLLRRTQRKKAASPVILSQAREDGSTFPLSFAQQRLWFLDQWEPGSPLYNVPLVLRLHGILRVDILERVLNVLVERHESLRTTFTNVDGQPVQTVTQAHPLALTIEEVNGETLAERAASILELAWEEARRPFDLAQGPLFRTRLLREAVGEYTLLLTMHHIISDGWSLSVFVRELTALYKAFMAGQSSPLPALPLQYIDYALWQRDWLQGEVLDEQLSYWRQQLAGIPSFLALPIDHPRPAISTPWGARYDFTLPSTLARAIKALSNREGATLFMTALAAFQVLLFRYTGQEDIPVGTPIANRTREEIEGIIGCFINTLVLRGILSGDPTFLELLQRVREMTLEAYAHQDLPFEKLVEDFQPERNLSHTPLFQVMFILRNASHSSVSLPDLAIETQEIDNGTAKFDIMLTITESGSLHGTIEYRTDLFEAATIERMARHYQQLLMSIVEQPDRRISCLQLLSDGEREQLVAGWNATSAPYPHERCTHHLFEAQVERSPEAIAVICKGVSLTYRELNRRANQLAHYLQRQGIGPEKRIGLCIERSLEMMVGLLGILKAGGAFVPLDPSYPTERLAFMLDDADVSLLLIQQGSLLDSPETRQAISIIDLEHDWQSIARESVENPESCAIPQNLAYIIYTSGSTGKPKGVMITHQGLVNYLYWAAQTYTAAEGSGSLVHSSICFDMTITSLFTPLLKGQRVTLLSGDQAAATLGDVLHAWGNLSFLKLTPTHLKLLNQVLPAENTLGCTHAVILGGEALHGETVSFWRNNAPTTRLINEYGPTEAVVGCCVYEIPPDDPLVANIPIGRPIANTRLYVLDAHLQPVPIAVAGELFIGGDGVARGYALRPDLTAERFLPDPFSSMTGQRLYRTGDMVRYLPDGVLEYLGRNDEQIKLRGYRIEPGEIEVIVSQHPAVRAAVVLAREDIPGDQRLIAYIAPVPGQIVDGDTLRDFLKERQPAYMIPSAFVILETLPLTASGKIDRQALPAPESVTKQEKDPESAIGPRNPIEEVLLNIWSEVLKRKQVGIFENFFELGGHSLLAIQLMSRLREIFQVELPLRNLFEAPTIAGQAQAIIQLKQNAAESEQTSISWPTIIPAPDQRTQPFPLTDVQQAYWVGRSGAFELGNVATHLYAELESNTLDVERLNQAWQHLIERHAMLRAIVLPDGRQQILAQVPPYQIATLDLRGKPPQEVVDALECVRQEMSHQILATDRWPLFDIRATLLEGHLVRLHLSADALMIDAGSWQILIRELSQLYRNPETTLPPLELSFRDYVMAEIAFRASKVYQRSQDYWWQRLSTLPLAPELPLAQNPAALKDPRFVRRTGRLEPDAWSRLKSKAAAAGLTHSALLLAAFAEVLTTWSKSPRFTINLTLFNRLPLHPQVNDIVGDFTSLTLLEVENTQPGAFQDRARRLQERLWEDLDHRYVSGVRVLRELMRTREGTLRAVMPIVFTSTLSQQVPAAREPSPLGKMVYGISQTPQVWLDHQVGEQSGALVFNWDAVEELFPQGLLDEMFASYKHFLLRLTNTEEAWLETTCRLVPPSQLEQRTAINNTGAPISGDLLHQPFEQQVAACYSQPAVIAPGRTLTYGTLQRVSNRLGRHLRRAGAAPNTLVAVVMEKGWEQVVAVLGILKAGAAYLPIDANLPEERLWYLLKHGEVHLVLTQPWLVETLAWPENVQVYCIEDEARAFAEEDDSVLEPVQGSQDLAYVIYTSGSTGQPKGAMIDHRGALNTIIDINQRFGIGPSDRVLALSSLSFDLSVYDIFGMLAVGGAIVFPEAARGRDPAHWAELLVQEQVTLWNSVPALMEMLVEYLAQHPAIRPASLSLVMLSGDWIPLALPDQIKAQMRGTRVISLGGATEASIWSILYPITTVDPTWNSIPYGVPMRNQQFHVLNEALEPCPVWVPGQLYIGGIGLAQGYWRDTEKTQASFIIHPHSGERLYRTGDLGRYLPDGNIEFLGREDFQVKIQGYRIELGEVESALLQHPAVHAAVVTAVGKSRFNRHLVAYVIPVSSFSPTVDELRIFLQEKLPAYMVPSAFMLLETLPLTANGKVDHKALPELNLPPPAPSDISLEEQIRTLSASGRIARIVAGILGVENLSPIASLLDLGANSIAIIRIVNQLESEINFRPDIVEVFRSPTIADLARSYERYQQQHQELLAVSDDREEGEL
ncbi:MAG TPA: amino acid adenylation domain-containing protein [Ktedonobacteraceae bacterium]|nr:amino acid adenylation domain-containing protein [Ktedonobacteraceae bacterium]